MPKRFFPRISATISAISLTLRRFRVLPSFKFHISIWIVVGGVSIHWYAVPDGLNKVSSPPSPIPKLNILGVSDLPNLTSYITRGWVNLDSVSSVSVGADGFEPPKVSTSRFTVCPIWPLWNTPIVAGSPLWLCKVITFFSFPQIFLLSEPQTPDKTLISLFAARCWRVPCQSVCRSW